MKPIGLTLENYRTFAKADIDFSNLDICAISGSNGAGKSTVIEAMLYALYGESRSKKVENVIKLGSDKMSVIFDYQHNGNIYRIIRKRTRSGRADLQYQVLQGTEFAPVTGSGSSDTESKIARDLGMDGKLFMLSSCVLQGDTAGICDLRPAERKAALYAVYEDQLAQFAQRHDIAKARVKAQDANMSMLRGQRETLEKTIALKNDEVTAKAATEIGLANARQELEKFTALVSEARDAYSAASAKADGVMSLKKNLDTLKAEECELKAVVQRERANAANCAEMLDGADQVRKQADQADVVESELAALAKAREEYLAIGEKHKSAQAEFSATVARMDIEINGLQSELESAEREIERRQTAAALLNEVPCKDTPMSHECKLLVNARTNSEGIVEIAEKIGPLQEKIKNLRHKKDRSKVESEAELDTLKKQAEAMGYSADTHRAKQQEYESLRHSRSLLAELAAADERKASAEKAAEEADRQARSKRMQILGAEKEYEAAVKEVGDIASLQTRLQSAEFEERTARSEVERHARLVAVHDERLASMAKAEEAITAIDDGLALADSERTVMATLQDAYSKNGIPALIMDAELSLIEEQANRILDYRPGDTMSLKFITQKGTSSGISETLDILIEDSAGERPFEEWSGGEKLWISVAVRIAIGQVLAQRSGAAIETLILDEVCAPLDQQGEDALVECVQQLHRIFDCILLISHRESIRDRLPQQIIVSKHHDGSRVETMA